MDVERLIKKFWLGLSFGFIVLVCFVLWGDLNQLQGNLTGFRVELIPLILLFTLIGYALRFLKWEIYLRTLGLLISPKNSLIIFLSGLSMSITPGKAGEILKSFLLKRMEQIEVARTAPIVLAERATDLMAMALLASWGITRFAYGIYLLGGTLVFLVMIICMFQSKKWTMALVNPLKAFPFMNRALERFEVFYDSAYELFRWKILAASTLVSVLSWFLECVSLYFVFQGLNLSLPITDAVFVFSFASVAGAVSMLPGGLGAAETSMVGILMALDVEKTVAVAATMMGRFGTLWFGVLLGTVVLFLFTRRLLKKEERGYS